MMKKKTKDTNQLISLIDGMEEGVIFADKQDIIVEVNNNFLNLIKKNKPEVIGKKIWAFQPSESAKKIKTYIRNFKKHIHSVPVKFQLPFLNLETIFRLQPLYQNNQYMGLIFNLIDVTELVMARKEAQSADKAKNEFLANISHEIRTPMNGILGMAELALNTQMTTEQKEYIEGIKTSSETLMTIINDVLDFSRIESNKIELEFIPFNLRDTVCNSVFSLAHKAREKRLELACHVPQSLTYDVISDPGRLRQLIMNIVGNAIKFTPEGKIQVTVEEEKKTAKAVQLHFIVTDTGIGISKDKINSIFEAFSQADGSTTRNYGGCGLGLTISFQLVKLMNGKIWVISQLGQGSQFHFTITLTLRKGKAEKPSPTPIENLTNLPVLVVDDNETNLQILEKMILNWKMNPTLCSSGKAALANLQKAHDLGNPYALALVDYYMPEMDGFMLTEEINDIEGITKPIIMMLSSSGMRGDAAQCRKLGITAYLPKPIKQSELLDAIMLAFGTPAQIGLKIPLITRHSLREARQCYRILLAEDNHINQKVATRLLEIHGHTVSVAQNGFEVLSALKKMSFDLILMDVQMPKMDGLEAAATIRSLEKGSGVHIPIIAMTAHAMQGDKEKCIKSGMDGYMSKPIDPKKLAQVIAQVINKSMTDTGAKKSSSR